MSATQLVLHHRYRHDIAYDWSRNRNHGRLVQVGTGGGPNPLSFWQGPSRVEVGPSDSLSDFGELRVRAVFRPQPDHDGPRRYNLVEGEFAFALFHESDGSLMGTVRSPTAGWLGPRSAPGAVTFAEWHTADLIHDGVSHARLYLDGVLVGERWDVPGPIRRHLGPHGVWIGHWPGDDRYTLRGDLAEVQIWKDDPHEDADRVLDDCCIDLGWLDDKVDQARRNGWGPEATVASFADLADGMRAAAAEVRGGDPVRAGHIAEHTRRAMRALADGDHGGLAGHLGALQGIIDGQLAPARATQLGQELHDLLRATPVGMWLGDDRAGLLAFAEEVARRTCLDDAVLPPRRPKRPKRPKVDPDRPQGDPDVDVDRPDDPEPSGDDPKDFEPPEGQDPDRPLDPGPEDPDRPDRPDRPPPEEPDDPDRPDRPWRPYPDLGARPQPQPPRPERPRWPRPGRPRFTLEDPPAGGPRDLA